MINAQEAARLALTQDPDLNEDHPLRLEAVTIAAVDGSRMSGVIMRPSGEGPHPTMLMFHGYPGLVNNRDLIMAVARLGWNALTFHYRGLWGSGGAFSWSNAIEDAQSAFDFVTAPESTTRLAIDPARIVLAGHSLGGFLAVRTASRAIGSVKGVAVLSGANLSALGSLSLSPEGYEAVMQIGRTDVPVAGTTIEALMEELQRYHKEWDFLDDAPALHTTPMLVVEANDVFQAENQKLAQRMVDTGNARVTKRFINTDHDFSSGRITLTKELLAWLYTLQT